MESSSLQRDGGGGYGGEILRAGLRLCAGEEEGSRGRLGLWGEPYPSRHPLPSIYRGWGGQGWASPSPIRTAPPPLLEGINFPPKKGGQLGFP